MNARRLAEHLKFYERAGLDTLPLLPDTRAPFLENWQDRAPREMWEHAPKNANIGIRCDGQKHVAILDADNKTRAETSAHIENFLRGLGISDCPIVQTPNDGRHFYFEQDGNHAGAYCHLARNIGAGEFRYGRGAMVAAPPSAIGGHEYKLIQGDFTHLPRVRVADLAPILAKQVLPAPTPGDSCEHFASSRAAKISLQPSRKAWRLLHGQDLEKYPSRSEHEQALLLSLVNSGYDFDAILALFLQYPCAGKFREMRAQKPRNAIRYLEHSFENARQWAAAHESQGRKLARAAMAWADSQAWRGRTGAIDRAVFLAHCEIAHRAARIVYAASARDLAELAGVGFMTATRATHRLRKCGLIVLEQEATFNLAHTFRLVHTDTLSKYFIVRECITTDSAAHDVFRYSGLGKTAAAVWDILKADTLTAREIIEKTGRGRLAVNRALERMFQLQMIGMDLTEHGATWYALDSVNLDEIARHIGTYGKGARQKAEHKQQRAARTRGFYRHMRPIGHNGT